MFEFVRSLRLDGDRATGTAEVPADHPLFADHFEGRPLLPGTWLLELAAQIAGPLAETLQPDRWAVLAMVQSAKLLAPVELPAQLELAASIARGTGDLVTVRVIARCAGMAILRGELVFALVEAPPGTEAAIRARHERLARWSR